MTGLFDLRSLALKIAIGFGIVVTLLVGMSGFNWMALGSLDAALREVARLTERAAQVQELTSLLNGVQNDLEDLAIAADADTGRRAGDLIAKGRSAVGEQIRLTRNAGRTDRLRAVDAALGAYGAAVERSIAETAKYEIVRPNTQKAIAVFGPTLAQITDARVAAGDARGAADAAHLLGLIGDGRRQHTAFNNSAGPALTAKTGPGLAKIAAEDIKAWEDIVVQVQQLKSHARGGAEGARIDELLAAATLYRDTVQAIVPMMLDRAGIRLGDMVKAEAAMKAELQAVDAAFAAVRSTVTAAAIETSDGAILHNSLLSGAAVLLALLAAALIARNLVPAIVRLTAAMRRLADGDVTVEVPEVGRRDEVGAMARTLLVFKQNKIEADRLAAAQEAEQAAKLARQQRLMERSELFQREAGRIVAEVAQASESMRKGAEGMARTADHTNQQSLQVASASAQTSANVQTVASASEELAASIVEIGSQVETSSRISSNAVEAGQRTAETVQELKNSAARIGDVVRLINDIASQTNLLALNATIEAARAGESGRGFAVVAAEVKTLAQKTAHATEEITAQILGMQNATGDAVLAIGDINSVITKMSEIAATIASAVEEQQAATREIARNVQQAACGSEDVTRTIADVTVAAGETGAAATGLLGSAEDLARQSTVLRQEVESFLHDIAA